MKKAPLFLAGAVIILAAYVLLPANFFQKEARVEPIEIKESLTEVSDEKMSDIIIINRWLRRIQRVWYSTTPYSIMRKNYSYQVSSDTNYLFFLGRDGALHKVDKRTGEIKNVHSGMRGQRKISYFHSQNQILLYSGSGLIYSVFTNDFSLSWIKKLGKILSAGSDGQNIFTLIGNEKEKLTLVELKVSNGQLLRSTQDFDFSMRGRSEVQVFKEDILLVFYDGLIVLLDRKSFREKWRYHFTDKMTWSPRRHNNKLFLPIGRNLIALDINTGLITETLNFPSASIAGIWSFDKLYLRLKNGVWGELDDQNYQFYRMGKTSLLSEIQQVFLIDKQHIILNCGVGNLCLVSGRGQKNRIVLPVKNPKLTFLEADENGFYFFDKDRLEISKWK